MNVCQYVQCNVAQRCRWALAKFLIKLSLSLTHTHKKLRVQV
jgi:hypothetical protein